MCPECQREVPGWAENADRCPECGSVRLAVVMGSVVCRECGRDFDRSAFA